MRKKLFYEFIGAKIKQKIEEGKASRFSTTKLFMIAEALETHASMLVIGWEEFEKLACAE